MYNQNYQRISTIEITQWFAFDLLPGVTTVGSLAWTTKGTNDIMDIMVIMANLMVSFSSD